jgi:sugar porter (SP) family MFS transporter
MKDLASSGVQWSSSLTDGDYAGFIEGLVTAASTIGAFLGSLVVFKVADNIGRKKELQIGACCYAIGAVGQFLSSSSASAEVGLTFLIFIRVVYGIGIAFSMHGAPTYIAEMAPPSLRGLLVSLKEAFIVVGILLGFATGYLLCSDESSQMVVGGWKWAYGSSFIFSTLMLFGTLYIPKSARWLLLKQRSEEAAESLRFVFPFSEDTVKEILNDIKGQCEKQLEIEVAAGSNGENKSIFAAKWRGPLLAGVGLIVLQQVTGQPSVLSYAVKILQDAGLGEFSTVLLGAFKFVATMLAVVYVDSFGRRKLLFVGNTLMLVALAVLSYIYLAYPSANDDNDDNDDNDFGPRQVITLIAMFIYIGGYQVGFGPIAWLMISECFPLEIRGQAVAFAVQMNFLWNLIIQLSIPVVTKALGNGPLFSVFTVFCVYSIYFVHHYVPETKGLSLEEIEKFFEKNRKQKGNIGEPTAPLLHNIV